MECSDVTPRPSTTSSMLVFDKVPARGLGGPVMHFWPEKFCFRSPGIRVGSDITPRCQRVVPSGCRSDLFEECRQRAEWRNGRPEFRLIAALV
jgi:hypothetical protein